MTERCHNGVRLNAPDNYVIGDVLAGGRGYKQLVSSCRSNIVSVSRIMEQHEAGSVRGAWPDLYRVRFIANPCIPSVGRCAPNENILARNGTAIDNADRFDVAKRNGVTEHVCQYA